MRSWLCRLETRRSQAHLHLQSTATGEVRSEVAREHYHSKNLVHWDHFHEVGWDTNERLACSVSEMYSVWLTKQVSGFCGTNHMLNTIYGDVVDKCPNCGFSPERSQHMALCPETEQTANSCVSHQFTSLLSG